jgi:hypothetical protein
MIAITTKSSIRVKAAKRRGRRRAGGQFMG